VFLLLLLSVAAYIAVEEVVLPIGNPLRRSSGQIAASLLERTPAGSTRAAVLTWINTQGWRGGGRPYPLHERPPLERVLGSYTSFGLRVVVFAHWKFDDDERLQTVEV
jgi:hypothetical protein